MTIFIVGSFILHNHHKYVIFLIMSLLPLLVTELKGQVTFLKLCLPGSVHDTYFWIDA